MTPSEDQKERLRLCAKWLAAYGEIYRRDDIGKTTIQLYASLLRDLPLDVLAFALTAAASECKRFPTPADIRQCVIDRLHSDAKLAAEKSWENLLERRRFWGRLLARAVRMKDGRWHDEKAPDLDWRTDAALLQIGGWDRFCDEVGGPAEPFMRRDFLQAFELRFEHPEAAMALSPAEATRVLDNLTKMLPKGDQEP